MLCVWGGGGGHLVGDSCVLQSIPLCKRIIFFFFYSVWALPDLGCCVGFSLVVVSRGYPLLQCRGFSLRWLLLW